MSLVRIDRQADINDPRGRELLHETLELMASKLARQGEELERVRKVDKIVRPVPIEAFPLATGQLHRGDSQARYIGEIVWRAAEPSGVVPPFMLACDGSEYSQTTYADLYGVISTTYNTGGETAGYFRVPDIRRRVIAGKGGTASKGPANTAGSTGGSEYAEQHVHAGPDHYHAVNLYSPGGGGGFQVASTTSGGAIRGQQVTTNAGTGNTSGSSNTDGGTTQGNFQPTIVMVPYIVYSGISISPFQEVPVSWGPVAGVWTLDYTSLLPISTLENAQVSVTDPVTNETRVEGVVKATCGAGGLASYLLGITTTGIIRVPYNFSKFKPDGFRIRTKLTMAGVTAGQSATITLKVRDPLSTSGYLANTDARTITVSSGTCADSQYEWLQLTAEELGPDWRPGYTFRFEVTWSIYGTFTSVVLELGLLEWLVK